MARKFLIAFHKDPFDSSMATENLKIGQIVGEEQVDVRFVPSRTHALPS